MITPSVHASAVKVGERAVLIRGPSGSGKSRLAFDLIMAGRAGVIAPAVLVGDDRVRLAAEGNDVIVTAVAELAGLIEIRGLGLRRCDFVERASVGLVVDLAASDAERLPANGALLTGLCGVSVPRIPVPADFSPLSLVVAALITTESSSSVRHSSDCTKGNGNHITPTLATD